MEIAGLIVAFLSLVVAIVALCKSAYASRIANNISYASVELEMRTAITVSSDRISDLSIQMRPLVARKSSQGLKPEEEAQLDAYEQSFAAAIQNYLNAYEELCAKYIDCKIDKIRFRKSFAVELRNLVEREALKKYFDTASSRYKAILKVYNEWENLEK